MLTIKGIKATLEKIHVEGGDDPVKHIEAALIQLHSAIAAMDTMVVHGRESVDALFGCMIAMDMIIGKDGEPNGGQAD